MLTYSFSDIGKTSLYEHLYNCIKDDILNGTLTTNEKLPSKRSFAKNLNISTITIENAYAQLMAEGYIYSIPKKGYYVSDVSSLSHLNPKKSNNFRSDVINSLNISESLGKHSSDYFADFVTNKTNTDNFPFSTWSKLLREIISEKNKELLTNPPAGGIMELRKAIADYLLQFRGMKVVPEQIIIGAGTEYIYGLLIQLFEYDSIYAIENPGHKKIAQIYDSHNVCCKHISMDLKGINVQNLEESNAQILHISPSHHFPTGIVTPINRRYELLSWAHSEKNRYIIEDDYDCEFRLQGNPIPSLTSIDSEGKVIYINTFSKSLASTIRISYMVLPPSLLELFYTKLGFYSCTVSNFEQYTLAKFISDGYFEKHINRQRNYFKSQRDYLLDNIKNSALSKKCTITEQDSGLHFLMKLDTPLTDDEIKQKGRDFGLRLACLSDYYYDLQDINTKTLVMNYSGLDTSRISEAIKRLEQIFAPY